MRNLTVNPIEKNPYIVKTPDGKKEEQTTKLIIGNLPTNYSNEEIEMKLVQLGCEPQSKLMLERDRDERGWLSRWLTGRRFVYIRIPEKISIGSATATLYYRKQKNKPENATCSRCFTKGHLTSSCTNDETRVSTVDSQLPMPREKRPRSHPTPSRRRERVTPPQPLTPTTRSRQFWMGESIVSLLKDKSKVGGDF